MIHAQNYNTTGLSGGLIIKNIFVGTEVFIQENNSWVNGFQGKRLFREELKIEKLPIAAQGQTTQKNIRLNQKEIKSQFKINNPYQLFLPPFTGNFRTPDQRLVLSYGKDTMILDFYNIPSGLDIFPTPEIQNIQFIPGSFRINLTGHSPKINKKTKGSSWFNFYRYLGINQESIPELSKYDYLSYTPPRNRSSVWIYYRPSVSIIQSNHAEVGIRLHGLFYTEFETANLAKILLKPLALLERYENGTWTEISFDEFSNLHPPDSIHESNYPIISASFFDGNNPSINIKLSDSTNNIIPGVYRFSIFALKNERITSNTFTLGRILQDSQFPYQKLFRDSLGYPSFQLEGENTLNINTPYLPAQLTDSLKKEIPIYYFEYFWTLQEKFGIHPQSPENEYFIEFYQNLPDKRLYLNETPYSGKIKFAFNKTVLATPKEKQIRDIYSIDYLNGIPQKVTLLEDVSKLTEAKKIR